MNSSISNRDIQSELPKKIVQLRKYAEISQYQHDLNIIKAFERILFEKSLEFMQKANNKIIELSTFDKHAKRRRAEKLRKK